MSKERCPICHAEVTYLGLERLECPTADCPNYAERGASAPERPGDPPAPGEQLRLELDQLMYELWCSARARL